MTGSILQVFPMTGHGVGPGTWLYGLAAAISRWSSLKASADSCLDAADTVAGHCAAAAAAAVDRRLAERIFWNLPTTFFIVIRATGIHAHKVLI